MCGTKAIVEELMRSPALASKLKGRYVAVSSVDGAFLIGSDLNELTKFCRKHYGSIEMEYYSVGANGEVRLERITGM